MLGAGYGLLKNSHVRIDFISTKLSDRARNWVDVGGIILVLFPFCAISISPWAGLSSCRPWRAVKCRKTQAA